MNPTLQLLKTVPLLLGVQQRSFLVSKEKADLSVSRCFARRANQSLQHMAAGSPPVMPATAGLPHWEKEAPKGRAVS